MSIYTKTGDKGSTSLFDNIRVKKYSLRVDTYGTFDECIAQVSVAEKEAFTTEVKAILVWIQEKLFLLNAEVATSEDYQKLAAKSTLIEDADIKKLEHWIDNFLAELPEIHQFILPGAYLSSAQLHVARTICRRGERRLIELSEEETIRATLLQFVNRLSDCLYVLARVEDFNQKKHSLVEKIVARYLEAVGHTPTKEKTGQHNLAQVTKIIAACEKKAEELNVPVTIALVDEAGHLCGSYRMADALLASIELARKKAYSAVAMKAETAALSEVAQPSSDLYQLETVTDGTIVTFGGGLPLKNSAGKIIGGIGVSGGSVAEDVAIAQAGLKCFKEMD